MPIQVVRPESLPPVLFEAHRGISGAQIAIMWVLASDLLKGGAAGSRFGTIAAAYIAIQFALDGFQPPDSNSHCLQLFLIRRVSSATSILALFSLLRTVSIIVAGANGGGLQGEAGILAVRFDLHMEDKNDVLVGLQAIDGNLPLAQAGIPSITLNAGANFDSTDGTGG